MRPLKTPQGDEFPALTQRAPAGAGFLHGQGVGAALVEHRAAQTDPRDGGGEGSDGPDPDSAIL